MTNPKYLPRIVRSSAFGALISLVCFAAISGCVAPGAKPALAQPTADAIAKFVTPITEEIVPFVLQKNPGYAPLVSTVADGLTVAFGSGNLTPSTIGGAVSKLGKGMTPETVSAIASGLSTIVTLYEQQYGVSVANATDPGVQTLLKSFADGLHNGVAVWQASQPK